MSWILFWETTQNKDLDTAWQRFSLIPPFTSPASANTQFLIRASSSKLAAARYLLGGWVAKRSTQNFSDGFLTSLQRFWLNQTVLCDFADDSLSPLWFQPAARLNDLTLSIWSNT